MAYPKLTLADLSALAGSNATRPVLHVDPETRLLDVDPDALVRNHFVVLTQEQLVEVINGTPDESVADQWAALVEGYSHEDVLEHVQDQVNDDIERILAGLDD